VNHANDIIFQTPGDFSNGIAAHYFGYPMLGTWSASTIKKLFTVSS